MNGDGKFYYQGRQSPISNVARKDRANAIKAAKRQIESYDARIEHARGNHSKREELEKRREHWVNHLKKLRGKSE